MVRQSGPLSEGLQSCSRDSQASWASVRRRRWTRSEADDGEQDRLAPLASSQLKLGFDAASTATCSSALRWRSTGSHRAALANLFPTRRLRLGLADSSGRPRPAHRPAAATARSFPRRPGGARAHNNPPLLVTAASLVVLGSCRRRRAHSRFASRVCLDERASSQEPSRNLGGTRQAQEETCAARGASALLSLVFPSRSHADATLLARRSSRFKLPFRSR